MGFGMGDLAQEFEGWHSGLMLRPIMLADALAVAWAFQTNNEYSGFGSYSLEDSSLLSVSIQLTSAVWEYPHVSSTQIIRYIYVHI